MTDDPKMKVPAPRDPPLHATEHCRHYSYRNTGLKGIRDGDLGGPVCALGIDLSAPGAGKKCWPDPEVPCLKREDYTTAERVAWKLHVGESMIRMAVIMQAIPEPKKIDRHRFAGDSGSLSCPGCKTGTVRYTHATGNGHLHAYCTTPHCFQVMQ